jgi:5-oxoprolinase (ATP-hydrolysing) subunit A
VTWAKVALSTSANVSCGWHAGDANTAMAALRLAARHGVRAGAHPSFPDRESFGRREMQRSEQETYEDCVYQIGALMGLARAAGIGLSHVKPHGALYNMACRDDAVARPVVIAASLFGLPVVGLPGSRLQAMCPLFVAEGFVDRRYLPDGSLVPRTRKDAFVEDVGEAVQQAIWLVRERGVQTLCVHGDNSKALDFVRALRAALEREGIAVRAGV